MTQQYNQNLKKHLKKNKYGKLYVFLAFLVIGAGAYYGAMQAFKAKADSLNSVVQQVNTVVQAYNQTGKKNENSDNLLTEGIDIENNLDEEILDEISGTNDIGNNNKNQTIMSGNNLTGGKEELTGDVVKTNTIENKSATGEAMELLKGDKNIFTGNRYEYLCVVGGNNKDKQFLNIFDYRNQYLINYILYRNRKKLKIENYMIICFYLDKFKFQKKSQELNNYYSKVKKILLANLNKDKENSGISEKDKIEIDRKALQLLFDKMKNDGIVKSIFYSYLYKDTSTNKIIDIDGVLPNSKILKGILIKLGIFEYPNMESMYKYGSIFDVSNVCYVSNPIDIFSIYEKKFKNMTVYKQWRKIDTNYKKLSYRDGLERQLSLLYNLKFFNIGCDEKLKFQEKYVLLKLFNYLYDIKRSSFVKYKLKY